MVAAVLLALVLAESAPPATAPAPKHLGDVLALAGRYAGCLEGELAVLVAEGAAPHGPGGDAGDLRQAAALVRAERVEAVAWCSSWRRAQVEVEPIVPVR